MRPLIVVMGITGVGKSVVGHELADQLDLEYVDGDDFHSEANIAKMSSGTPLTDEDRWPWLDAIGEWLSAREDSGGVVSCSALRRIYRDVLRKAAPRVLFCHLYGDHAIILERMERRDHFMPPSLLTSQEETLEQLEPDEKGWAIDIAATPAEIAESFIAAAGLEGEIV